MLAGSQLRIRRFKLGLACDRPGPVHDTSLLHARAPAEPPTGTAGVQRLQPPRRRPGRFHWHRPEFFHRSSLRVTVAAAIGISQSELEA